MRKLWSIIGVFLTIIVISSIIYLIQISTFSKKIVKIGAILPLTGPASFAGELAKMGLDLAVDNLHFKNMSVKIIYQDGQGDPRKSIDAFHHLVFIERTKVIITYISQVGLALKDQAETQKIVLFANVTHPEMTKSTKFVFRMSPVVESDFLKFTEFLNQKLKNIQGSILVLYQTDEYGASFSSLLRKLPKTYSCKAVPYDPKQTDFRSIIVKELSKKQPNLVAVVGFGQSLGILIRQIREYGYKGDIYASLGFILTDAYKIAGETAKDIYYPDLDINTNDPDYKNLEFLFEKKFGRKMPSTSWLFYNTLLLIAEAINKVGDSPVDIANYIRKMRKFRGIGAIFDIQPSGDIIPRIKLTRWGENL